MQLLISLYLRVQLKSVNNLVASQTTAPKISRLIGLLNLRTTIRGGERAKIKFGQ